MRIASTSAALLVISAIAVAGQTPTKIPLRQGLTVVTAIAMDIGDGESIKRITAVDGEAVHLLYSADVERKKDALGGVLDLLGGGEKRKSDAKPERERITTKRSIRREDLKSARRYQAGFNSAQPAIVPGTTAIGTSAAVLLELRERGQAEFACACQLGIEGALGGLAASLGAALGGKPGQPPPEMADLGDGMMRGTLKRVEPKAVSIPVLVNNQRVDLPAIHAKGRLGDQDAEFYFLDDPENPLALRWQVGENSVQAIKISFPSEEPSRKIETALETAGRVEVYGIYFDLGSATIKPESEPVLQEIADALVKNPAWKISVEGHTDNVGGDAYNLDLSRRRAAAVRDALVTRYRVGAERLATSGFGASRPKEPNETLAGRARNRRVELVRR
jgi:outer membrane protein OmpA-like peptidoglycan-associated protein